jgi:hypothetical protein
MSRRVLLLLLLTLTALALAYRHWQNPAPAPAEVAAESSKATTALAAPADADASDTAPDESAPDPEQVPATNSSRAAFRASVSQRADDRRRLASDTDLPAFVAELRARANAGDADAALTLTELYQSCVEVLQLSSDRDAGERQLRGFMSVFGWGDAESDLLIARIGPSAQRCATLGLRSSTYTAMISQAWQARALQLEHPAAVLGAELPNSRTDPAGAQAVLERARLAGIELLRQAEPMDLVRYSPALTRVSRYNSYGYLTAACHLLAGCADDSHAYAFGPDNGITGSRGRLSLMELTQLSPRDRIIAEAQAAEILRLWREGRPDLILAPRNPGGGG